MDIEISLEDAAWGVKREIAAPMSINRDHPIFKREGVNLLIEPDISFADAALSGEIKVPTLFGSAKLTLPEGTQTGTECRPRGAGLDRPDSRGEGDLVVRVRLNVPKNLSNERNEQLRRFAGCTR
jgi:molecular chaperone DnaJ